MFNVAFYNYKSLYCYNKDIPIICIQYTDDVDWRSDCFIVNGEKCVMYNLIDNIEIDDFCN